MPPRPLLPRPQGVGKKNQSGYFIAAPRTLHGRPSLFVRDKHIFSSERMLRKGYYRKRSVEKISGRGS
jgi:hypothetical protein